MRLQGERHPPPLLGLTTSTHMGCENNNINNSSGNGSKSSSDVTSNCTDNRNKNSSSDHDSRSRKRRVVKIPWSQISHRLTD